MAENNNGNQEPAVEETPGRDFGELTTRENEQTEVVTDEKTVDQPKTDVEEPTQEAEGKETSTKESSEEGKTDDVKLTEKGTKLDPNPLSAAHQELANEKRVRSQMEQVLASPELLARFMEDQYGVKSQLPKKDGEAETTTAKEYKPEDFENLDDVAKVVNTLQSDFAKKSESYETQIKQLTTAVQGLMSNGRIAQVASTMEKDVAALQVEPELDPKNPEYIDGLEKEIAEQYHKLDFDEKSGMYRGDYSLKELGDRMISVARKSRAKGSLQAQTIVKDKSEGKVTTSPKVEDNVDEEKSDPTQSIAAGVSKLFAQ